MPTTTINNHTPHNFQTLSWKDCKGGEGCGVGVGQGREGGREGGGREREGGLFIYQAKPAEIMTQVLNKTIYD
jgi:hypothetical protein